MDFTWQIWHKNLAVFHPSLSPHLLILGGNSTQPNQIKNDLPSRGNWRSSKKEKLRHPFQTFPVSFSLDVHLVISGTFLSSHTSDNTKRDCRSKWFISESSFTTKLYWLHLLLHVTIFKPFSLPPLFSKIFEVFLKKTGSSLINITLMITESSICHQRLLSFIPQRQARHFHHVNSCLLTSASGKVTFPRPVWRVWLMVPSKAPSHVTSHKYRPTSASSDTSHQKRVQASSAAMATATWDWKQPTDQMPAVDTRGKGHRATWWPHLRSRWWAPAQNRWFVIIWLLAAHISAIFNQAAPNQSSLCDSSVILNSRHL